MQSQQNIVIRKIVLSLTLGYMLFFFGERVFWSFPRADDSFFAYFFGWLVYAFGAYLTLIVISYFKVRSVWALFLSGAFFGWFIEGVYAMTLFGGGGLPFPIGISWTGLAWHALLSFFVGFYLVMKLLNENRYMKMIFFSIALGIFWGVWSLAWVLETPPVVTGPDIYLLHGLITTSLLWVSYYFFSKSRPSVFKSSRRERIIASIPVLAFFAFVTVPTVGPLAVVLPVLFFILYRALKKNRDQEKAPNFLESLSGNAKFRAYLPLLLSPVIAAIIYNSGIALPTNLAVLGITTVLGFIFLGVSLYKTFKRPDSI
jgi:hypothetical protein